jgi:hypothetical protein
MLFELYQKLCVLTMKKGRDDGNLIYKYMVMTWNLPC